MWAHHKEASPAESGSAQVTHVQQTSSGIHLDWKGVSEVLWWTIAWGAFFPAQQSLLLSYLTQRDATPLLTLSLSTSGCNISTQMGTTALYTSCTLQLSGFTRTYLKEKGIKHEKPDGDRQRLTTNISVESNGTLTSKGGGPSSTISPQPQPSSSVGTFRKIHLLDTPLHCSW